MSEYLEYWPKGGDKAAFISATEAAVRRFMENEAPSPPKKINAELDRLRSAIKNLSSETREEISSRELSQWQNARPDGTWFDDQYIKKNIKLRSGAAALDSLEILTAEKFERTDDRDAVKRKFLIASAAFTFTNHGGKIEAGGGSLFVKYLQHLFTDVGMEHADFSKAVRDFVHKNGGVLD
jgi:hypothetical protein